MHMRKYFLKIYGIGVLLKCRSGPLIVDQRVLSPCSHFYHRARFEIVNRYVDVRYTMTEVFERNHRCYGRRRVRAFAAEIGLKPLTTPASSPQSNGMAESFVKTMKRDYITFMPKPDAPTAIRNLAIAFEHYNEFHPHSALNYRAPREFRRGAGSPTQG